jgi:hypothetical protein
MKNDKIGCDFDGTLANYGFVVGETVKVNVPLLGQLRGSEISILTNQGGLPFGIMNRDRLDGRKYPQPVDFVTRFKDFVGIAKGYYDITVVQLQIALFHPKADNKYILEANHLLFDLILEYNPRFDFRIYLTEAYRKPNPRMLELAEIDIYYGDSDEDEGAALEAGVEFVKVERFI